MPKVVGTRVGFVLVAIEYIRIIFVGFMYLVIDFLVVKAFLAEWSKAVRSGRILNWRGAESLRMQN